MKVGEKRREKATRKEMMKEKREEGVYEVYRGVRVGEGVEMRTNVKGRRE